MDRALDYVKGRIKDLEIAIKETDNEDYKHDYSYLLNCFEEVESELDVCEGIEYEQGERQLTIPVVSGCYLDSDEIETALSALSHAIKKTYHRQQFDRLKQLQQKLYKAQTEL